MNNPVTWALCIGFLMSGASALAGEGKKLCDIKAGDAGDRLTEFAYCSETQMVLNLKSVAGVVTQPLQGEFTRSEALTIMLQNTGLTFRFVNDRTIVVLPEQTAQAGTEDDIAPITIFGKHVNPDLFLDQVLVTGTHISGAATTGAQVISLTRGDMDASAYSTAQDIIRALPQNFGGGPSEDTRSIGGEAATNISEGTSINLSGLGAGSTIVLMDGRRFAPSGTRAGYTDVSNIPWVAVERIEVVSGASPTFGADAVGGIVNFVMRDSYEGAETSMEIGAATAGSLQQQKISQLLGKSWSGGGALVALEYQSRDALSAADRRQAVSDLRAFGGDNFDVPYGNPGTIIVGQTTWAIPTGQDGRALSAADLERDTANLYNRHAGTDLLPSQKRLSAYATWHQSLGERTRLSASTLYSERIASSASAVVRTGLVVPQSNAFYINPTGGTEPVVVGYAFDSDLGSVRSLSLARTANASVGVNVMAFSTWDLGGHLTFAQQTEQTRLSGQINSTALEAALADSNPETAFNPFGDGSNTNPQTLDAIRSESAFATMSSVITAELRAEGKLLESVMGPVRFATGVEQRRESFNSTNTAGQFGLGTQHDLFRATSSLLGELRVPVWSGRAGDEQLSLSLATRYDYYSDFSSAWAPSIGLTWQPLRQLEMRGRWTRFSRPPKISDLNETENGSLVTSLPDRASSSGYTRALLWYGNNAELQSEEIESWSLGGTFRHVHIPSLSVALTYTDTRINGRAEDTRLSEDFLENPWYAALVDRTPTSAQRNAVCARTTFLTGRPSDCFNMPVDVIVDLRIRNRVSLRQSALDLTTSYNSSNIAGQFTARLNAAYVLKYSQSLMPLAPFEEMLNTQNNPIALRFRASLDWSRAAIGTSLFLNFANSYRDVISQPPRPIGSWTTIDAQLRYNTGRSSGRLSGTQCTLSVQNLFNKDPPFLNNHVGIGYDEENADLLGRFVSFRVSKEW